MKTRNSVKRGIGCVSVLLAFLLAFLSMAHSVAHSSEYHVSPSGSDAAEGTREAPWRTIQKAAEAMRPGDVCIVHAGVYRETVRPARSGTATQAIRFEAASGEEVWLTGTDLVTQWTHHEGRIHSAAVDWPVDQVFVHRRLMIPARHPDAGEDLFKPDLLPAEVESGTCTIDGLEAPADFWKGGYVWGMHKRGWVAQSARIAGSGAGHVTIDGRGPFRGEGKVLLFGVLGALDAPREWHQQDGRLYLWGPDGNDLSSQNVEATRRRWVFDLTGRAYIEVADFRIFAGSIDLDGAEHCTLEGIRARMTSFERTMRGGFNRDRSFGAESEGLGIALGGRYNTIRSSVVAYCIGDGISVFGSDNRVENCVIHDCNLSASDCAPINCTGTSHTITRCTIFNAGRSGIVHRKLRRGRITYNHIFNCGRMTNDLGGTYCFTTDGEGTVIAYNRVHDVRCHTGVGIYVDNQSPNHVVHHNLCYNCEDCGIRLNTPTRNVLIVNNTLSGNGRSIAWWDSQNNGGMEGSLFANNIMTDSVSPGRGVKVESNFTEKRPGFVAPETHDFRLADGSPCIDAGRVVEDMTGTFHGKAPDIGCFEHGQESWSAGSSLPREVWDEEGW